MGEWSPISEMLNKRHQLGAVRFRDVIVVAGAFSSKIEIYTPAADTFVELNVELPNRRNCTALCTVEDKIYIFNENVYLLNLDDNTIEQAT